MLAASSVFSSFYLVGRLGSKCSKRSFIVWSWLGLLDSMLVELASNEMTLSSLPRLTKDQVEVKH